ncbi:MAG: hypothetical protein V3V33_12570 [Candidatus Lokiarchaeia archaeon]
MEGGKKWHITPNGRRIYPLGAKQNTFTKCMSDGLKGNMITGDGLTKADLKTNRDKFKEVLDGCKVKKAPKRKIVRPKVTK